MHTSRYREARTLVRRLPGEDRAGFAVAAPGIAVFDTRDDV
ncbi:MAG: hypothetical protein M5U26_01585 [Planctomycetota bacterium]|nr:hypothetical protein [Planctomycetota bacterium]